MLMIENFIPILSAVIMEYHDIFHNFSFPQRMNPVVRSFSHSRKYKSEMHWYSFKPSIGAYIGVLSTDKLQVINAIAVVTWKHSIYLTF